MYSTDSLYLGEGEEGDFSKFTLWLCFSDPGTRTRAVWEIGYGAEQVMISRMK